MMVFNRPLGKASGVADGWTAQRRISHTQDTTLIRHAIQIETTAIKIVAGSAARKRRRSRVLRSGIFWHRLLHWIQQNGIDIGLLAECSEKG